MFTQEEIDYIKSQHLARIATISKSGQPDVAPVGFEFDGEYFYIGGRANLETRKYLNVQAGNKKVALAIDDLVTVNPWRPRGMKIHGTAEIVEYAGRLGNSPYLKVTPLKSWSWGIGQSVYEGGKFIVNKNVRDVS